MQTKAGFDEEYIILRKEKVRNVWKYRFKPFFVSLSFLGHAAFVFSPCPINVYFRLFFSSSTAALLLPIQKQGYHYCYLENHLSALESLFLIHIMLIMYLECTKNYKLYSEVSFIHLFILLFFLSFIRHFFSSFFLSSVFLDRHSLYNEVEHHAEQFQLVHKYNGENLLV